MTARELPSRADVEPKDTWDLSLLFVDNDAWERAFTQYQGLIDKYDQFKGRLGESAESLAELLEFDIAADRVAEKLSSYACLKVSEDVANGEALERKTRFFGLASLAGQKASYIRPEILAISSEKMAAFLQSPRLAPHRITLDRILRQKPHTLGANEERILAMQSEMAQTASQVFTQLNNADLKFKPVRDRSGQKHPLSHGSLMTFLHSSKRPVRKKAFKKYYAEYRDHANTLAATLEGSIKRDVFHAKVRNFAGSLEAALFDDNVPVAVYNNLIDAVRRHLPTLHRYYAIRKRAMKIKRIHHYDTYVPIISKLQKRHTWDQAVSLVLESLNPLGDEYVRVLREGLQGRWCDRYENKGKQSGAFSSGSFDGPPYILMNYQKDVLDHVFTLAHEAGHSMHTHYASKHQPYQYYNYTIFVAEVASTFNEQLLGKLFQERARTKEERAFFVNRQIDEIRATIYRQTMFAEFEKITHELAEKNEALTLDRFQKEYRSLLEAYFGPDFALDEELSLECFRIPHFYRAFYVYKYATGLSAAIALSQGVLNGGEKELSAYLGFLKGGCSKFPLDLLRDAGVDMETPTPVDSALTRFAQLVDELDNLV